MLQSEMDQYVWQAIMYDQLARYYKYSNPQMHIEYYLKHYEATKKLINEGRALQLANIRVLHASPTSKAVDVYINGQRILQNVPYKQFSNYLSLPQGQYRIDVYETGTQSIPILSGIVPFMSNYVYTVVIAGDDSKLDLLSFIDQTYLPYNEAKIRFAHLSPDTPVVDVALKDGDTLFQNVAFKQSSDYVQVSPGIANIEVRMVSTENTLLSLPDKKIEGNKIYTIYAVGFMNKSPKLEALFLTN
ncbi:DUF4397 domain-containing protein [Microbacteriaceae bacterium 4G12]